MKVMPLLALCLAGSAAAAQTPPGKVAPPIIKAITAPSEDLMLAFARPGRIAKVLVREGQHVKAGQLLAQIEDSVERVQSALLKAKAENTTAIKAAELRLARGQAVLKKVQEAYDANAAPKRELEDARIDAAMAQLDLELAQFNHQQDQGRYQEALLALERMRLLSPVEAEVERVYVQVGEVVGAPRTGQAGGRPGAPAAVVRLVRTDPLWIDVPAPTRYARGLAPGQTARVRFADAPSPVKARIIRVSKVADAASETLEVRLELPNPTGRPAGEHVTVRFPAGKKATPRAKANSPNSGNVSR